MEEPSLSINGKSVSQRDVLDDLDVELEELDEFDIAIEDDLLLEREEKKEEPHVDFYEDYGGYKIKVTPQGHDYRGLPMIHYMGELRPHYSALDKESQQVLQIQMIAELSNYRQLYPQLGIPGDDSLMTYSLNVLHTYLNEKRKVVRGMKYAVFYEKSIIGTCMTIEGILRVLGVDFMEDFTVNQIEVIPIYKILASSLATEHGAGPMEGQSPTYTIAIAIIISLGLYGGARYLKGKDGGTTIYKVISGMANKNFVGENPSVTSSNTTTQKSVEEPRVPSPLEKKEEEAPSFSIGGVDIGGMMSQAQTFLPMVTALMGGDKDEKEKKKKKKKRRFRQ